jgi:prepilin-type N-terminal cleavage/methylation domain-containing protein
MDMIKSFNRGMTLTELVIVVVLVTVIIGAAITPFIMQQGLLKQQMAISTIQDDISVALSHMNKDTLCASSVELVAGSGGSNGLRLEFRSIANQLTEIVDYTLSGDNIVRAVTPVSGAQTEHIIARNITRLEFTMPGNNYIEVLIEGQDDRQAIIKSSGIALRATRAI